MSYPGSGGGWSDPSSNDPYGQQPNYGGQPNYGQPPTYGQPGFTDPSYGQPSYDPFGAPGGGYPPQYPPQNPPQYGSYGPPPGGGSNNRVLIIVAAVVVVLLVAGGLTFALTRSSGKPDAQKSSNVPTSSTGDFGGFGSGAPTDSGSGDVSTDVPTDGTDDPTDEPTDQPTDGDSDGPAVDGPTVAESQDVVKAYLAAVNAQDKAAAQATICTEGVQGWLKSLQTTPNDFSYTWTNVVYESVSADSDDETIVTYSVKVTDKSGSSKTMEADFYIVYDGNDAMLCGRG